MIEIFSQLTPIFFFFVVGILLKQFSLADKVHGDFLLRLAFFVTLPLLILTTLPNATLSMEKAILPLSNIVVNLGCMCLTLILTRFMSLDKKMIGSMLMCTMVTNNAFMFPFILAIYGESGFADAILYDFGNAIMVATFTYAVAFKYGGQAHDSFTMFFRILKSPLFWSLGIAITLSLTNTSLPQPLIDSASPLAQMTSPVILIALGIFFSLNIKDIKLVGFVLAIRMALGLVIGSTFARLAGLEGDTLIIVSLCSAAPIGFMALTFTSMAKLDMELSTSAVSLSIVLGLFYIPILIFFFGGV